MDLIFQLVQLIKISPKRSTILKRLQQEVTVSSGGQSLPSLRTLCPTRWTVRHAAINSILLNYELLVKALEEIQLGHDEYASKARGMLAQLESFDIYFGLKLSYLIISAAEQFSINLQAKNITVQEQLRVLLYLLLI